MPCYKLLNLIDQPVNHNHIYYDIDYEMTSMRIKGTVTVILIVSYSERNEIGTNPD